MSLTNNETKKVTSKKEAKQTTDTTKDMENFQPFMSPEVKSNIVYVNTEDTGAFPIRSALWNDSSPC